MTLKVVVSYGEFLDKLTILKIKSERIKDETKLKNVQLELNILEKEWAASKKSQIDIDEELNKLKAINERLWDIEDKIRDKERNKEFDQKFIELARSVYFSNDERARIKRLINEKLGSDLIEEKSYQDY